MDGRLNTTKFTTVHYSDIPPRVCAARESNQRYGAQRGTRTRGKRSVFRKNSGLLLLLGVCSSAFMLLFVFQLVRHNVPQDALAVMQNVLGNGTQENESGKDRPSDGSLGKLQLVQLPSILEVFAPSELPIPPLSMSGAVVDDDSYTAKIYAPKGTLVSSVLAGTVKSVSPDEGLGGCVVVAHSDNIEVYYYGLSDILVERGQPILQNSSLGTLAGDVLYLRVTKEGRPLDPFDFLGVKAELNG